MGEAVEKITPYASDSATKTDQVREMFDSIAPAYDFMNGAMTLGIDRLWRRKAVAKVAEREPKKVLDVATGTADVAIAVARKLPDAEVTGVDLSDEMLRIGREKVARKGLDKRVTLMNGDGTDLRFSDGSFDSVVISYGIRNFESIARGYSEMYRVLRPGGLLVVVELSVPRGKIVKHLYRFYTRYVVPLLGRGVSKNKRAYSYLPESIEAVPQGERMTSLMKEAGFVQATAYPLTFGTCTIYVANK